MASSFPSLTDDSSGLKLGRYEVISKLSAGGMSEIFLAFQKGVGGFRKYCVLKRILPDIRGEESFVRMFLDEAKITAAFNHPNIAHVYDLGIADDELFLAMEFVPGATLIELAKAAFAAKQSIPLGVTLQAVRDTALALHYAHTFRDPRGRVQPVIHRDVAEKNIMVTYEGVIKLLDFGIAKNVAALSRTNVGTLKGTSGYMSPEQILGESLDGRSDIFALGVVLHECLTGVRLFHSKNKDEAIVAPLKDTVNPPSALNPAVSPALDAVTMKALKRDRNERYATALEFARELERAANGALWMPEQTAALMGQLFAERQQQTRELLDRTYSEDTGEIRMEALLDANGEIHATVEEVTRRARVGTPSHDLATNPAAKTPVAALQPAFDVDNNQGVTQMGTRRIAAPLVPWQDPVSGEYAAPSMKEETTEDDSRRGKTVELSAAQPPPATDAGLAPSLPPEPLTELPSNVEERTRSMRPRPDRRKVQLAAGAVAVVAAVLIFVVLLRARGGAPERSPEQATAVVPLAPVKPPPLAPEPKPEPPKIAQPELPRPVIPPPPADVKTEPKPEPKAEPKPEPRQQQKPAKKVASHPSAKQQNGTLTLVTIPWAKVTWRSQSLGVTPLFQVSLPAGKHVLQLTDAQNRTVSLPIEIKEGGTLSLKQKLSDLKPE